MEELIRTEVKEILSNIIDANFNAISKKQNAKEYVSAIIDEYNTIQYHLVNNYYALLKLLIILLILILIV